MGRRKRGGASSLMENKKRVFHDKERSDGSRKGVSGEVGRGGVIRDR